MLRANDRQNSLRNIGGGVVDDAKREKGNAIQPAGLRRGRSLMAIAKVSSNPILKEEGNENMNYKTPGNWKDVRSTTNKRTSFLKHTPSQKDLPPHDFPLRAMSRAGKDVNRQVSGINAISSETIVVVDDSGRFKEQKFNLRKRLDGSIILPYVDTTPASGYNCPFVFEDRVQSSRRQSLRPVNGIRKPIAARLYHNTIRKREKDGGICEICRVKYRSYSKHVNDASHKKLKREDGNNRQLEALINLLPKCVPGKKPTLEEQRNAEQSENLRLD